MARRRAGGYVDGYLDDEIQAFVVSRYCGGMEAGEIRSALARWLNLQIDEIIEHIVRSEVRRARDEGRLSYRGGSKDSEEKLSRSLEDILVKRRISPMPAATTSRLPKVASMVCPLIEVVATTEPIDVALRAARRIRAEILTHFREPNQSEINIGFAGGATPSLTAKALAELITTPNEWPDTFFKNKKTLCFHSIVGSLDSSSPEVDPNSFLTYLATNARETSKSLFNLRFHRMPGPGIVGWDEYRRLTNKDHLGGFALIQDAMKRKNNLDIIIASCGHWNAGCHTAHDYINETCQSSEKLKKAWEETAAELDARNILGDLMWWPIGSSGPFRLTEQKIRIFSSLTIFDLVRISNPRSANDIEGWPLQKKGKIILLAGPCSGPTCRDSKGKLLSGILRMARLPMTHLIVDSRSARDCIEILED